MLFGEGLIHGRRLIYLCVLPSFHIQYDQNWMMVFTGVGLLQFELKFLWDMYMLVTGNFCVGGSLL